MQGTGLAVVALDEGRCEGDTLVGVLERLGDLAQLEEGLRPVREEDVVLRLRLDGLGVAGLRAGRGQGERRWQELTEAPCDLGGGGAPRGAQSGSDPKDSRPRRPVSALWHRSDGTFSMLAGRRLEVLLGLEVRVALLLGRVTRSLGRGHSRLGHSLGLGRCDGHVVAMRLVRGRARQSAVG